MCIDFKFLEEKVTELRAWEFSFHDQINSEAEYPSVIHEWVIKVLNILSLRCWPPKKKLPFYALRQISKFRDSMHSISIKMISCTTFVKSFEHKLHYFSPSIVFIPFVHIERRINCQQVKKQLFMLLLNLGQTSHYSCCLCPLVSPLLVLIFDRHLRLIIASENIAADNRENIIIYYHLHRCDCKKWAWN